jgi:hypothetical protein
MMIPEFYRVEMSFEEACRIVQSRRSDRLLLDALKDLQSFYEESAKDYYNFDEDRFFSQWCYEYSAMDIVVSNMRKLFQ